MNTSYTTQESGLDPSPSLTKSKKFWGRMAWISAIAVIIPPLIGVAGTVMGTLHAFNNIGQPGKANPEEMAGEISVALLTTMVGLLVSCFALLVFVVAITFYLKLRQSLRAMAEEIPSNKGLE